MNKLKIYLLFILFSILIVSIVCFLILIGRELDARSIIFSCLELVVLVICGIFVIVYDRYLSKRLCAQVPAKSQENVDEVLEELQQSDVSQGLQDVVLNTNDRNIVVRIQDKVSNIQEGMITGIFIYLDSKVLGKINVEGNITLDFLDSWKLCIIQNGRRITVNGPLKCEILTSNDSLTKIGNSSGLYILARAKEIKDFLQVRNIAKMIKITSTQCIYSLTNPRILNKTLFLRHEYLDVSFLKTKGDIEEILAVEKYIDNIPVTMFNILLIELFKSCPDKKKFIYPVKVGNKFIMEDGVQYWINTPDGKLALFLLSNFSLREITGTTNVIYQSKRGNLSRLVNDILCYIDARNKNGDFVERIFMKERKYNLDLLINRIRNIEYEEKKIDLYEDLHMDYRVNNRELISSLMYKDLLNNSIYKYIFAIASYQVGDSYTETNEFIRKLLYAARYQDVFSEIEVMLADLSDEIVSTTCIDILKILSVDKKKCNKEEIINCARHFITRKYMFDLMPLRLYITDVTVGSVEDIILTSRMENNGIRCYNRGKW
ncbi:hypothetical protein K6025_02840 [Ehrlichia sp. JZT12]